MTRPIYRPDEVDDLEALARRVKRLELATSLGTWQRIGFGDNPPIFGPKFADLSATYQCWWRQDSAGMMWLRGIAGCTVAAGVNDTLLNFPVGRRMGNGFSIESPFAVALNNGGEKAGLVMFQAQTVGAGNLYVREAIPVGGWVGLDSVHFLVEA